MLILSRSLTFFFVCLEGLPCTIFTKPRKEFEQFGSKIQKNVAGKKYSRMRNFGAEVRK